MLICPLILLLRFCDQGVCKIFSASYPSSYSFSASYDTPWCRALYKLSGKLWILRIRQLLRKLLAKAYSSVKSACNFLISGRIAKFKVCQKAYKELLIMASLNFISASSPGYQGYRFTDTLIWTQKDWLEGCWEVHIWSLFSRLSLKI